MRPPEVRRMYEFLALYWGLGGFLVCWPLAAHRLGLPRSRTNRAPTPFCGVFSGEILDRPFLGLARKLFPRDRLLLRPRHRALRKNFDHPEHIRSVPQRPVKRGSEHPTLR